MQEKHFIAENLIDKSTASSTAGLRSNQSVGMELMKDTTIQ
jgi:hypothetical protein